MSSLSTKTLSLPGWSADPLARRITLARISLALERLLPALWPAAGFVAAYLALALLGVFAYLPWALQALLLASVITATGLSLYENLDGFLWPRALEGARRLERDSGFVHRPISEKDDVLSGGAGDAFARALWQQHQLRTIPADGFRVAPPHADLKSRDPYYLRYVALFALAAGLVLARGHVMDRLASAFDSGAGAAASIDAWIDPPAYTDLPLQSLTADDKGVIAVPAGSALNLRVHGAGRAPGLAAGMNAAPRFAGSDGEYASNAVITRDARVQVRVGGHAIGDWRIHAVPDAPPIIVFTATPGRTERDALKVTFDAHDDYGIASARIIITPHGRSGAPLSADLPLAPAKEVSQASFVDLTAHPYAGLLVDARLEARDAIGQKGLSRVVTFRLPARVFTDPLARALIEQRQNIATADAAGRQKVAAGLDALAIAPERFYDGKTNIYLALRAAYWGTKTASHAEEITHVEDLLWQTAMALERGGLLTAAEELRKLQAQITQALAAGAPQEVIDELLKRYNEAMQRYMQALANNPPAPGQQQPLPPDAKVLGQNDIQALLKAIQQLSQSGAREQAAQMLALLQNMLENMRMAQSGQGGGGQGGQGNKALNDAIQKFGDIMGKQRGLLDKTFRQNHGQADPKDGGPQGLAKQQGDLEKQLNDAVKGLDPKLAQKLRDAGKAMGEAKGALGQKDFDNAGNAQKNALEALRQGASDLAKEAMKSQNGQREGKDDPLGRGTSPFGSSKVKIPGPSDLARAREILQELRRRAGEMNRPQQERDYIDRLLKSF
jgi:uncharacterized protein (TIGR02302 family)